MIAFIAGMIVGGLLGIAIMCILNMSRDNDENKNT